MNEAIEPAAERSTASLWRERAAFAAAAVLLVVLQLALTVHAEQFAFVFPDRPLSGVDFDTHAEQTWCATEALDRWGQIWAYDPQLLAGYPNGTAFEADNKGWDLWTYALWKLGLPKPVAFNLFVVLAHLLVVPVVYVAARLFDLSRWGALLAAFLALMVWFFDSLSRWNWFTGAVAFGIVTVWFTLPLGLFYRYLERGGRWLLVPLTLTLAVGHLVHPGLFLVLVAPMVALYARSFRRLSRRRHGSIAAMALLVIAANSFWLVVAFRFAHYLIDHRPFFVAGPSFLVTDALGVIQDMNTTGMIGNRTGFRLLVLGACLAALLSWRRSGDRRALPFGVGVGLLVAITYFGGYSSLLRQLQPYRNAAPAAFLACIGAAAFFVELARSKAWRRLPRGLGAAAGIVGVLASVHLVRDALYFLPTALPPLPALPTGERPRITPMGYPSHQDYRHKPVTEDVSELARWVQLHADGQSRFLVSSWWLGEHLLWRTDAPILGGFRERNMGHAAANIFRAHPEGDLSDAELAQYFETYAVRWVILTMPKPRLEQRTHLLRRVTSIGLHRIYETTTPVSFFQRGSGAVRASLNRIDARGTAEAEDVVLRFHWLETLRCEPKCQVVREPVAGNSVGFIRVPAPHPPDFAIVNGY